MNKPHKHAELIKAWADGAEIEYKWDTDEFWTKSIAPTWVGDCLYRIKPEPKPDVVRYGMVVDNRYGSLTLARCACDNIKLTFDGETGALKAAEVLK